MTDFIDDNEFECYHAEYPVCPYCGHKDEDWWEWCIEEDSYEDVTCSDCGKDYNCESYITWSFTTEKKEENENEESSKET